ncbi:hypothetical protein [Acetobacter persici]|nr:hypothetical protein [Acetobacter persici]
MPDCPIVTEGIYGLWNSGHGRYLYNPAARNLLALFHAASPPAALECPLPSTPAPSIIGLATDSMRKLMSSDEKKPPKKETAKPTFVPRPSIFEQRTGQKGADTGNMTIGDAPSEIEQISAIVDDLLRALKK